MPAKYPCGSSGRRPVACPPPSASPPSVMPAIGSLRAVVPCRRPNRSPRASTGLAPGRGVSRLGAPLDDLRFAPEPGRPPGIPGRVELPGHGAPLGDLGGDDGGDVGAGELAPRRLGGPEAGGTARDVLATAGRGPAR